MANTYFQFKRFVVEQQGAAMKVGTDGVLLGAWCRVTTLARRVLDVGTGTGLLALMIAQRSDDLCREADVEVDADAEVAGVSAIEIDALEIDEMSARQAAENFIRSPWNDRLNVIHESLQEYSADRSAVYDHIVSNPPYFNNSLQCPDASRTKARHTADLNYHDLAHGVDRLLAGGGYVSLIIPCSEARQLAEVFDEYGFTVTRQTEVYPNEQKPPKRVLLELMRKSDTRADAEESLPIVGSLVIETDQRHHYTDEYKKLTSDFYL